MDWFCSDLTTDSQNFISALGLYLVTWNWALKLATGKFKLLHRVDSDERDYQSR
jgi:hypothetical protein